MVGAILIAVASASFGPTSDLAHVATFSDDLSYPGRLAARPGGGVYVTEQPTNTVVEYTAAGAATTHSIPEGPVGIAVHSDGRVFISRADGKIGVYDSSFSELNEFVAPPITMDEPNDMVFDPISQELYVVDSSGDHVIVFGETGPNVWTFSRAWGNGHDFGTYGLSDDDIDDLVEFIKNGGVVNTSPYINTTGSPGSYSYSFNGDPAAGATLYAGGVNPAADCSICHGGDGTAIDFGGGKYVGTVANDNPQETLHKIRFGHPGSGMISYFDLGMTDTQSADVVAHAETLP